MRQHGLALAWVLASATAQGQSAPVPDDAASTQEQRRGIQLRREQETAAYARELQACASTFAATDCQRSVQARKRESLAVLRRQEIALGDMQRRRQSALLLDRRGGKSGVEWGNPATPALPASATQRARPEVPQREPAPQDVAAQGKVRQTPLTQQRVQREAADAARAKKKELQFQKKLSEAAQHRGEVQARQARSSRSGAKPLPEAP